MPVDALQWAVLAGDPQRMRAALADLGPARRATSDARSAHAFLAVLDADFDAAHRHAVDAVRHSPTCLDARAVLALTAGVRGVGVIADVEAVNADVLALPVDILTSRLWAGCMAAEAAMSLGLLATAEATARRVHAVAGSRSDPHGVFAGQTLTRALLFQGRLAQARSVGSDVSRDAVTHGLEALRLVLAGTLAYVAALGADGVGLDRGVGEIERLAPSAPRSYFASGSMVLAAYALAADGQAARSQDMLLAGAGGPHLPRAQALDRIYGFELLVTAALARGELAEARGWARRALAVPVDVRSGMAAAALRRTEARMAAADGDPVSGARLAELAAAAAQRQTGHLDAARASLIAGSALLHDLGDAQPARARLTRAADDAALLGATSLLLLARRDLRSIGLRPTGAENTAMSRREREVATLVIAGLTNGEIARALSISARTVQSHVARVLQALDLPSRSGVPRALAAPSPGPGGVDLTPRQREVAELVARGYTNDGIARALGISVKTVEKHLGDIYARVGVSGRTALAGRLHAVATEPSSRT